MYLPDPSLFSPAPESFPTLPALTSCMPRNPRCIVPHLAHHVTQRGVDKQKVFFCERDRTTYLNLLHHHMDQAGAKVLAWCLMPNHVHLVVVPDSEESLAVLFRRVNGRYAQYLNATQLRAGHLWRNRFFSCPVSPCHEEIVLRYVELNPVRASLVERPEEYKWSSAAAHFQGPDPQSELTSVLDWTYWLNRGGAEGWRRFVGETVEDIRDVKRIRRATHRGSPLGSPAFIAEMEVRFDRRWTSPGRPKKGKPPSSQEAKTGTLQSGTSAAA